MVDVSTQFYLSQLLEISRVSSGKDASKELRGSIKKQVPLPSVVIPKSSWSFPSCKVLNEGTIASMNEFTDIRATTPIRYTRALRRRIRSRCDAYVTAYAEAYAVEKEKEH